jgi:hypothetical protein
MAAVTPPRRRRRRRSRRGPSLSAFVDRGWLALVVALVPLVTAAVRTIRSGWVPVGDAALIAVRSHDVLGGGELPLIGMWSAKSMEIGLLMNHPGPLFFDALALPAAVVGGSAGQVVGATLVNAAATVGIFLVARRQAGPAVAATAVAVAAALAWSMGSAVLAEPWTATTILLPFLCFVLTVWALACGDAVCLPWAALLGSFVLQANLGYVPFVPVLLGFGVLALAGHAWPRQGSGEPHESEVPRPLGARRVRRSLAWTGAVLALCWAQPLVEQLTGGGEGNLVRLARGLRQPPTGSVDIGRSLSTFAKVVALPPWWGRPSFASAFPFTAFGNPLPPVAHAVVGLAVLAGLLAWAFHGAARRRDRAVVALLATALVLLAVALSTAIATPVSEFGTIAYRLRWLWPVGAFVTFALVTALVVTPATTRARRVAGEGPGEGPGAGRWPVVAVTGVVAVLAGLNLPASDQGTTAAAATQPVARAIVGELARADLDGPRRGPLLVDCAEGLFDPYCEAVMVALQQRDVRFVVREDGPIRQLGDRRRWTGANAVARLEVVAGDRAVRPLAPAGADRVALHRGLAATEHVELLSRRDHIRLALRDGVLRLGDRGRRVAARGDLRSAVPGDAGGRIDPAVALAVRDVPFGDQRREIVAMIREDLLAPVGDPVLAAGLVRYADLQQRWDDTTVAVVLGPLPPTP